MGIRRKAAAIFAMMAILTGFIFGFCVQMENVEAKSKSGFYYGSGYEFANITGSRVAIQSVSYDGETVSIKGYLYQADDDGWDTPATLMKQKKHAFPVRDDCKYIYTDGRSSKTMAAKKFFKRLDASYGFTRLSLYVGEGGKVYKMHLDYSW